jgi:hypothetical protein
MGRQVIYRPWVVDAVAAWHAKQAPGRSLSPSTAASEVVAHAGIPAAGCGPSIVAALLVKNHGWVHADRMLWRPMFKPQMPQMPMKIASVAPVTMSDDPAMTPDEMAEFRKCLKPAPPVLPGELI